MPVKVPDIDAITINGGNIIRVFGDPHPPVATTMPPATPNSMTSGRTVRILLALSRTGSSVRTHVQTKSASNALRFCDAAPERNEAARLRA
jgi:hypothetical protein